MQSCMPVRAGSKARQVEDRCNHACQSEQGPRLVRWRIDAIIHASQVRVQGSSSGGLMQSFMPVRSVAKARQVED